MTQNQEKKVTVRNGAIFASSENYPIDMWRITILNIMYIVRFPTVY
jgi:hypothetical protein